MQSVESKPKISLMASLAEYRRLWECVFVSVCVAALLLLGIYLAVLWHIDIKFIGKHSCSTAHSYTYCFFSKEWDSETYLASITGFYQTIITLLIFLVTLIAGLAFLFIRVNAVEHVREQVKDFIKTGEGGRILDDSVTRNLGITLQEMKEVKENYGLIVELLQSEDINLQRSVEVPNDGDQSDDTSNKEAN